METILTLKTLNWKLSVFGQALQAENSSEEDYRIMLALQPDHCQKAVITQRGVPLPYGVVDHADENGLVRAQGLWLKRSGSSVAIATRDCGVTIFSGTHDQPVALVHTGRDQLLRTPDIRTECRASVIQSATSWFRNRFPIADLEAYSIGHIHAGDFPHSTHPRKEQIQNELAGWTQDNSDLTIVKNQEQLTICLQTLIKVQLRHYKVLEKNIQSDDCLDPFRDPRLGSTRAKRPGSNVFVLERL